MKFMPKSRLFDRIDGNNWFKLMDAKHRVYNYKDNEFHMAKASDRLYRKLPKAFEYLEFVDLEYYNEIGTTDIVFLLFQGAHRTK